MTMRLRVLLPTSVLIDAPVRQVDAEGHHGHFTLLPRHVDVVAALVPGVLSWLEDEERVAALDGGVLVKRGAEVTIGTARAVVGTSLADLRRMVDEEFRDAEARERTARSAVARLEVDFIQRFLKLEEHGHG
jgi:F-type H+-transporting ATPase subunit epsilon